MSCEREYCSSLGYIWEDDGRLYDSVDYKVPYCHFYNKKLNHDPIFGTEECDECREVQRKRAWREQYTDR